MQPRRINSIDELLNINKPQASVAPQQPAFQARDFGPQIGASDVTSWVAQNATNYKGGDFGQALDTRVDISLDPTTRRIKIQAPQYYVDSPEFKEQVLPAFQKLEGREFTDTDFNSLVNSDMVKDMQKQADDVRKRVEAIQEYKMQFPKASDDDALIYLRNAAAANLSDKDTQTQLVTGVNEDGTLKTSSVKDFMDIYKGMDDSEKGQRLKATLDNIEQPDFDEKSRAIQLSLMRFLKDKKVLEASGSTKWDLGMQKFLSESDKSVPGWIYNQTLGRISSGTDQTQAEQYRESLENDPRTALEGVDPAMSIGGTAGQIGGVVADIAAAGPIAELAVAKGAAAASKVPGASRAIQAADEGIQGLKNGGAVSKITAGTIQSIPRDLSFGVQRAAVEEGYNAPQDFALNTAINAATLGGAKIAGRALREVDTATNGALLGVSEGVGKGIIKGLDKVGDIPGIGKVMKSFTFNFIDQAAPLRRAARSAWSQDKITTNEYMGVHNAIRSAVQRGRGEAETFMRETPEFSTAYQASKAIADMGESELERANQYVNAVQELQYAKAGRYKVSDKKMKELETFVAANQSPELDSYRQALADWSARISDFGVQNGVLDDDLIRAMRDDPAFAAGYIRLQRSIPGVDDQTSTRPSSVRNLKNKETVKKLKGPADLDDLSDPFAVASERLSALAELAAQNKVNRIAVQAINEGWVNGRVLQSADDLRERATIRNAFKEEREIVDNLVDSQVSKLEGDLNKLVDDVEDFNGSGRVTIAQRLEGAVDDMVDTIAKDPKLNDEIVRLMDELGGGKEGAERVAALGVLNRNKQRINERLEKSLLSTELGREERAEVVRMLDSAINNELDAELAARSATRGPLSSRMDELRKLNKEISPNADLQGEGVQAYYDRGTKGYYELADPDMINYFNMRKMPGEDGLFARLMTNTSRVFKLSTTGLNPAFIPVNLLRDIPQATVTSGTNMLSPSVSHKALLESLGLSEAETDRLAREFDAFIANSTQFEVSRQAEETLKSTYNIGRDLQRSKLKSVTFNLANPKASIKQMEDIFGQVETATRARIYQSRFDSAIRRGLTTDQAQTEALFYAAQATADFLNVGARVQNFVRTVPYLTAAINGKASFMRLLTIDPVGVTARMAAGFVMPITYLTAHNLANPELAAGYFTVPEWERQNNMVVMLDRDSYIKIPLPQDIAAIAAPFRERIEAHYGLENANFMETMGKFVLGQSPVSLAPLVNKDFNGDYNVAGNAAQIASGVVPQIFRQPLEMIAGSDLYTGAALNPTDEELYARGQIAPGEPITPGDRTFAGRDSQSLRNIANLTGLSQATFQNAIKNYGGAVGQMILNGVDKLAGAPEERQGGKALGEALAGRFFGGSFNQAESDYYRGLGELDSEKKLLEAQLTRLSSDMYGAPGDQSLISTRERLIDEFGQKIANFADRYGEFYSRTGGLRPFQLDSLVRLLDFGPDQGTFAPDTYESDLLQQARNESRTDAARRATDLGLPTSNERDRYGRLYADTAGKLYDDNTRTSLANTNINDRIYGSPKQLTYEFSQIVKGDRKTGAKSLYDVEQSYFDRIDALYQKARGLKGKEAQDIYSQISDIQEEYMKNEFDPRIKPLLDKYGPEALMNNKEIFNEIGSRIMIPNDFTPFTSRKKQPYQKDDVEAYLLDRYGVGNLNKTNLPSDKQVLDIISRVNADLSAGRTASAQFKLDDLQDDIDGGRVYVDAGTMENIKNLISVANRR